MLRPHPSRLFAALSNAPPSPPRAASRRLGEGEIKPLLQRISGERNIAGFVLGLPINMDGSEGPRAQSTRAFARNFSKLTELPIAFWDERLSTSAVERELIANDVSRAKRAKVIDEHAAIFILQGALDRLAALARSPDIR